MQKLVRHRGVRSTEWRKNREVRKWGKDGERRARTPQVQRVRTPKVETYVELDGLSHSSRAVTRSEVPALRNTPRACGNSTNTLTQNLIFMIK